MNWHLAIGLAALFAVGVAIYREDRRRARHGDIEALIDATRETIPDHVPADWVKEHNQ